MHRLLFAFLVLAFTAGCGPHYVDYFPYQDDGTAKPCIALAPIADCSKSDLNWDLAEELNCGLRYTSMDNGNIFLLSEKKMAKICERLGDVDYFDKDLSFAAECSQCEFLVALEIMEHRLIPYKQGELTPIYTVRSGKCDNVLVIKVRMRVIDLREETPCVVLQEIFCSNHMIPRDAEKCDYSKTGWGTEGFNRTAYGLAHQRLIDDLVNRIECVTWKAR
jgi:hypothetical protein